MNGSRIEVREDQPNGNDLLDRQFENGSDGQLYRIDDEWWFEDNWGRGNRNSEWVYKNTENPIHYHSEWLMRSRESRTTTTRQLSSFSSLLLHRNYTEEQINRVVDNVEITKHAAIRGYIGDWDSFTLGVERTPSCIDAITTVNFSSCTGIVTWGSEKITISTTVAVISKLGWRNPTICGYSNFF